MLTLTTAQSASKKKQKWVILTGYFEPRRQVTVYAKTENEAFILAGDEADRRCILRGSEPPVAWDVEIVYGPGQPDFRRRK